MNQQSSIGQLATILAVIMALWTRAFVEPVDMEPSSVFAFLYTPLYDIFSHMPRLASAVALLLIVGEGVLLNVMLYNNKMIATTSLIPLLIYIVSMSWMPSGLTITPLLLVNLIMLIACRSLLSDGATTLSFDRNFNASMCIGVSALVYLPSIALIIPYIIVFNIYKMYSWRDIVVSLFGIAAPLIVFATYAYMTDRLDLYVSAIGHDITAVTASKVYGSTVTIITNTFFLLISIVALFHLIGSVNDKLISTRINSAILTVPILAAIVMALYSQLFPLDTQLLAIPFTFLVANYATAEHKHKWIISTMALLFIAMALTNVWTA